jgi:hypothetical protein
LAFRFVSESRHSDIKRGAGERIAMAPKKASKKGEEQPESDIISDTTAAGVVHNIKESWTTIADKMKGDVMLKVWETKLQGYKGVTEEVINHCERIFDSIEKDSTHDENNGLSQPLGEINIDRHQLKIREELEEKKTEISNVKAVNISEIEKWMIGPSSKLERIKSTERQL